MAAELLDSGDSQSVVVARQAEIADDVTGSPLEVNVVHVDGSFARVAFVGELDAATVPLAASALAATRRCVRIEADVEDLAFCGAAGLGVFVEANQRCIERGGRLQLENPQPMLNRLLEISGLEVLLAESLVLASNG